MSDHDTDNERTAAHDEALARGRALRRKVFGPMPPSPSEQVAPRLREISDAVLFGDVWSRPGLELWERSMVTIAALTALGRDKQLEAHIRGGLNVGLPREKLVEMLMHLAFYCGFPAANSALTVAHKIFAEADAADGLRSTNP
jgi:4-carboxymuconolactone decarboxylase